MTVQILSADLFIESMTFHQRIFCMEDFQTFSYAHRFGDISFNFNSHVNNILDVIELDDDEKQVAEEQINSSVTVANFFGFSIIILFIYYYLLLRYYYCII